MTDTPLPRNGSTVDRIFGRNIIALARRRFANAGVAYNSGNWIALAGAAAVPLLNSGGAPLSAASRLVSAFAGDAAALALSLGSLLFVIGGARYARAWAQTAPPDFRCVRQGHALSAAGALCVGLGLALIAKTPLALGAAVCGGALHALGKLGSACRDDVRLFKVMPLLSRSPALASLSIDVWTAPDWRRAFAPVLLIACNLIWARADMMLLKSVPNRAVVQNAGE